MIEITFIISTLATLAFIGYMYFIREKQFLESHQKLINALVARDATQLRDLTLADKTEVKVDNTPIQLASEFEETAQLSDEKYMEFIKKRNDEDLKQYEDV